MTIWLSAVAFGDPGTEELLLQRIAEVAPLRSSRLASGAPSISEKEYREVAAGKVVTGLREVDGVAARKVYGAGIFEADIAAVWAGINDEVNHVPYTALDYSEIVKGAPCESGRHTFQFLPVPIVSDRWWITVLTHNTALADKSGGAVRELAFESDIDPTEATSARAQAIIAEATPLGWSKGSYFLVQLDAHRTLMEYYVWTDPGGSIPAGASSWFASGSVTDQFEALQKFVKDGVTRCRY